MRFLLSAACVVGLGTAGAAHGAVVINSGFEALTGDDPAHFAGGLLLDGHLSATANPLASPLVFVTPDPAPFWTVDTQAGGTMNPTEAYMPGGALDGEYVGWSSGALIYQVLVDEIEPLTTYTFTVHVGRPTVTGAGFAYRVIMESLGLVMAQDVNSQPIGIGEWGVSTVTWDSPEVVPSGAKLTINLAADIGVALFDDIEVAAGPTIPEPSLALVALAPLASVMLRRRR